jgi:hypothetical protein
MSEVQKTEIGSNFENPNVLAMLRAARRVGWADKGRTTSL